MHKNVYTYNSLLPLYALACNGFCDNNGSFDVAVGTFLSEYANKIEIVRYSPEADSLVARTAFPHLYPPTNLVYAPTSGSNQINESGTLLASSGEYVRLWFIPNVPSSNQKVGQGGEDVSLVALFKTGSDPDSCSPFTSLDWNHFDRNLIVASSVDSSCTVFDLQQQSQVTQFFMQGVSTHKNNVAHGSSLPVGHPSLIEAYDVSLSTQDRYLIAAACSNGTVQLFDQRHNGMVAGFQPFNGSGSILRIEFNPVRPNLLASISDGQGECEISISDIRRFAASNMANSQNISNSESRLKRHTAAVNAITWAPHKDSFLCSTSNDCSALVWAVPDLQPQVNEKPLLAYNADSSANNVHWPNADPERIALVFGQSLQLLKV